MPIFRKLIVTPNVYRTNTPVGRRISAVTKDTIKQMAETTQAMIQAGIKIPAPFAHKDDNNIVPSPLDADGETDIKTRKKKEWSSDINGGFWTKFEATTEGLVGYLDVPEKVADKVGTTIKETSVFMDPNYEDGLGRKWKNALRHVALVTNAVEPNQKNFELVDLSPEYTLAMSFSMSDAVDSGNSSSPGENDPSAKSPSETADTSDEKNKSDDSNENDEEKLGSGNIPEIVSLLKDKLGYELPSDTTPENFLDRLRTLLTSIKKDEEDEEEDFKKNPKSEDKPGGDDSEVRSSPVAMSDTPNQDNLIVALEKKSNKLLEKLQSTLKEMLTTRINAALQAGKIGKRTFQALTADIEALAMSLDDFDAETGEFKKTKIEEKLEMAEDLAGFGNAATAEKNPGGDIQNLNEGTEESMTKEEMEQVFKFAGF